VTWNRCLAEEFYSAESNESNLEPGEIRKSSAAKRACADEAAELEGLGAGEGPKEAGQVKVEAVKEEEEEEEEVRAKRPRTAEATPATPRATRSSNARLAQPTTPVPTPITRSAATVARKRSK